MFGTGDLVVMIVDMEPAVRAAVTAIFRYLGCAVVEASDGVGAIQCLRNIPVDIALVDEQLPVIRGKTICSMIAAASPETVCVLSSGVPGWLQGAPASVALLLPKPYGMREIEVIVDHVRSYRAATTPQAAPAA